MRQDIDPTARLTTFAIMKETPKLSLCLWILTGLSLTACGGAFLFTRHMLKLLHEIPTSDKDQSAVFFQMKTMIEGFGDVFYRFAFCLLVLTMVWYLLVRKCLKLVPVS